jgi:hypothetical protein
MTFLARGRLIGRAPIPWERWRSTYPSHYADSLEEKAARVEHDLDARAGVAPPRNMQNIPSPSRLGTAADCSPTLAPNFRLGTLARVGKD